MNCSKCGSDNINFQIINEGHLVNNHHSILWWLTLGW